MRATPSPDGWFVKCGTCSTKHAYPPAPQHTGEEATSHLLGAKPVIHALARGTAECVMIRPWDSRVSDTNEVRVFARQGRVTGVSQQACYAESMPLLGMLSARDVISAAQVCFDRLQAGLPVRHRFGFECTFDAFLVVDDGGVRMELIEINSEAFGWGPAGASLFHWETDPPPRPDQAPVFYLTDRY